MVSVSSFPRFFKSTAPNFSASCRLLQERERLEFFLVELLEEARLAQVERAAGLTVLRGPGVAVVEAPPRRAAGLGPFEVSSEVVRLRLPLAVAAAERLLVMNG